jgi:hypothetical protein
MERLPKRVNEWLNRVFESLGADPAIIDKMIDEHQPSQCTEETIKNLAAESEKGLCRSLQELLFSERDDSDFKKIDFVKGLEKILSLLSGNEEKIAVLISIKRVLQYYYANPCILEIEVSKDDAAIAAAELKRQRKADRLRKQMKVAN